MHHTHEPDVPAIETDRLSLRAHRLSDFDESAALWGDPDITRHIGGKTSTREESWTRLLRYIGHWAAMGFGYWVVREQGSGRFVGEVGFADYKREMQPSIEGAPEIGWVVARWAQGRGFATEAVSAVLAWGAIRFGAARTVCIIDPENLASIRVAEKSGYAQIELATYRGQPILLFAR